MKPEHSPPAPSNANLAGWGDPGWATLRCALDPDGILVLTLSRPERLNAFTPGMCGELIAAFDRAGVDDAVRCVIVTGAGRAFCAGMELAAEGNVFGLDESKAPTMAGLRGGLDDPAVRDGVLDLGGQLAFAIHRCLKPVAAAINGAAVGVGATMTLAMDFRLASSDARIGFVFNRIGIVPEACSSYFLPRLVGLQQALEWFYAAEPFTAEEGLRGGLLRSVHPPDELLDAAKTLMRRLTIGRSPLAQAVTRQLVRRNADAGMSSTHLTESLAMHALSRTEGREGVAAFLEKRSADFRGRVSLNLPSDFDEWWDPTNSSQS